MEILLSGTFITRRRGELNYCVTQPVTVSFFFELIRPDRVALEFNLCKINSFFLPPFFWRQCSSRQKMKKIKQFLHFKKCERKRRRGEREGERRGREEKRERREEKRRGRETKRKSATMVKARAREERTDSSYELQRQERMSRNLGMLEQLKIEKTKSAIRKTVNAENQSKMSLPQRKRRRHGVRTAKVVSVVATRKSSRIRGGKPSSKHFGETVIRDDPGKEQRERLERRV